MSSMIKTVTTIEDNCGGVTSYAFKTVTTVENNWGGVISNVCKTMKKYFYSKTEKTFILQRLSMTCINLY